MATLAARGTIGPHLRYCEGAALLGVKRKLGALEQMLCTEAIAVESIEGPL